LAVSTAEEERWWERFDQALGLTWDIYTLMELDDPSKKKKANPNAPPEPVQLPRKVRTPLLLAMAPDFFKHLSEDYSKKYRRFLEVNQESGGGQVIEIGNLSPEQARDLFKRIGPMVAAAKPPTTE